MLRRNQSNSGSPIIDADGELLGAAEYAALLATNTMDGPPVGSTVYALNEQNILVYLGSAEDLVWPLPSGRYIIGSGKMVKL